jgi:hypothetical protein
MFLIYFGILLLSSATLLFEITLTRVFSVAQWYHFAFMVVSLALLGFGASGSLLSLFPRLINKQLNHLMAICAALFSLGCLGSYLLVNSIPFDSYRVAWESRQLLYLVVYYLSLAVPFLFTGLALGVALSKVPSQAGKLYSFNMLGSGLGCLLVLIGLPLFGCTGTVALAVLIGLAAVCVFIATSSKLLLGLASAGGIGLILLTISLPGAFEVKMSPYKSLSQVLLHPQTKILWTAWNAFSRVDVVESGSIHIAPGLSFNCKSELPAQLGLTVDGANMSPISQIETGQAEFSEYLPGALVYRLSPRAKALIVEPQGGLDVLSALHYQSSSVVAVVSNPLVIKAIETFGEKGNFLSDPRVKVAAEGVRSYLRRSQEQYDVIQVTLTDSFQVVGAGAYSLSEDYRYTVEAFKEYYRHLAPEGYLCVTRWLQMPPSEEVRLMSLATATLEGLNISHPEQHMSAIRTFQTVTLLVKKSPFSNQDIVTIKDFNNKLGFDIIYFPGIESTDLNRHNVLPREVYHEALSQILSPLERRAFLAGYAYDVSPPTDDRPFFFHFFRWSQAPYIWHSLGKTWQPFGGAGYLLVVALLLSAVLASAIFILLPLYFRPSQKRGQHRALITWVRWQLFAYFSALGLGFLFIEIPLMQKFILFLDQPTYSFAIVLFTIFICSGLGSLLSLRLSKVLPQVIVSLSLLAFIYPFLLPYLFDTLLGESLLLRLFVSFGALAPLSFMMGVPFPWGIRTLGTMSPESVPWAWGINGCVSVVTSILSLMLALSVGFSWVLIAGGGAYLVGAGIAYHWVRKVGEGLGKEQPA